MTWKDDRRQGKGTRLRKTKGNERRGRQQGKDTGNKGRGHVTGEKER